MSKDRGAWALCWAPLTELQPGSPQHPVNPSPRAPQASLGLAVSLSPLLAPGPAACAISPSGSVKAGLQPLSPGPRPLSVSTLVEEAGSENQCILQASLRATDSGPECVISIISNINCIFPLLSRFSKEPSAA